MSLGMCHRGCAAGHTPVPREHHHPPDAGLDCENTTNALRRMDTSSRRVSRRAKLRAWRILHRRLNLRGSEERRRVKVVGVRAWGEIHVQVSGTVGATQPASAWAEAHHCTHFGTTVIPVSPARARTPQQASSWHAITGKQALTCAARPRGSAAPAQRAGHGRSGAAGPRGAARC